MGRPVYLAAALLAIAGVGVLCAVRDKPPAVGPNAEQAPSSLPSPPGTAPSSPAPSAPQDLPATEAAGMERLRQLARSDPQQALALAAELERRHPGSAHAEERASLIIDALVNKGDIGQARTNAEEFLIKYPEGPFAEHVQTLTGVHPRPTGPDPRRP
jgi:hypothetical protein